MNDGIKITPFENGLLIKIYGELDSFHVLGYKDKIVLEMKRYNPYLLLCKKTCGVNPYFVLTLHVFFYLTIFFNFSSNSSSDKSFILSIS